MSADDVTPENERMYTIGVQAFGLTPAQFNDLFDRIADAAHAKDEQLFCFGGYDTENRAAASVLRDAADEGESFLGGETTSDVAWRYLRERADRIEGRA